MKNNSAQESWKSYLSSSKSICPCGQKLTLGWVHSCDATRLSSLNFLKKKFSKMSAKTKEMRTSQLDTQRSLKKYFNQMNKLRHQLQQAEDKIEESMQWLGIQPPSLNQERKQARQLLPISSQLRKTVPLSPEVVRPERKKVEESKSTQKKRQQPEDQLQHSSFHFTNEKDPIELQEGKSQDQGFGEILKDLSFPSQRKGNLLPAAKQAQSQRAFDLSTSYTKVPQMKDLFGD